MVPQTYNDYLQLQSLFCTEKETIYGKEKFMS